MTYPARTLYGMAVVLVLVAMPLALAQERVLYAFQMNPWFNALICALFGAAAAHNFVQVRALFNEVAWINEFRRLPGGQVPSYQTRLLAPMAQMLARRRGERLSLTPIGTRSLLESVSNRLVESREISRYCIGLLIFLGLLGTFWGLMKTVQAVSETIQGMTIAETDAAAVFGSLKQGLARPLSGMGISFSSSLFGLAGSLVLGFLDLQTAHAQQRFYNELEEWLSGLTRLASSFGPHDSEAPIPAYVQALLEQAADGIERLQRALETQAGDRHRADEQLLNLSHQLADLTQQLKRAPQQQMSEELRQELRLLNRTLAAALDKR